MTTNFSISLAYIKIFLQSVIAVRPYYSAIVHFDHPLRIVG